MRLEHKSYEELLDKYNKLLAFTKIVSVPQIKSEWLPECYIINFVDKELICVTTDSVAQTYEAVMMPSRKDLIITAKALLQEIGELGEQQCNDFT